jgi:hypothetical protein
MRMQEATLLLQESFPGGAERKSRRGGSRAAAIEPVPSRRRSFEGFIEGTPDPPKTVGRNTVRTPPDVSGELGADRSPLLYEQSRAREGAAAPARASRAGAPNRPVSLSYRRQDGVWLSVKAYRRFLRGRERAEYAFVKSDLWAGPPTLTFLTFWAA